MFNTKINTALSFKRPEHNFLFQRLFTSQNKLCTVKQGGNFCGLLTHGKVGMVSGGKQVCGMINLFLVNRETRENVFHVKISCFTV